MSFETFLPLLKGLGYVIAGYIMAKLVSRGLIHLYRKTRKPRYSLLIEKTIFYVIFVLFLISALRQWGFDLKVLLGATGILTIAIGFASQTSASNFISGLFLLGEDTLRMGDSISINGVSGRIVAIDLFSIKIQQSDNTLVRIPNEILLKTQVVNLSHAEERRFECDFSVPGNTSIPDLRKIVLSALSKEPLCLQDPAPSLQVNEIGSAMIKIQLWVWSKQENFSSMKYRVQEILVETLRAKNIGIADNTYTVKLLKDE